MSPPRDPHLRVAVGNSKGGVGKTTTAVGIAVAAARAGRTVLLVDGDPQGNASSYLTGYTSEQLDQLPVWATVVTGEHSISEAILSPATATHSALDETTRATWAGIDLLPSSRRCAALDKTLGAEDLWSERDALDEVTDRYQIIVVDCPPHLGTITLSHLYAVNCALIVTEAARWGLDGINEFNKTIRKVARSNRELRLAGVLINQFDRRESAQREYAEYVRESLGAQLIDPPIPNRAVIRRAANANLPVAALREREARDITDLYDRLLTRLIPEGTHG